MGKSGYIFIYINKREYDKGEIRMKILIVSPYFPPDESVAVVRIASLCRMLVAEGNFLTLLTNKKTGTTNDNDLKRIRKIEVDINKFSTNKSGDFNRIANVYKNEFLKCIKKEKFDIVLITCGPYYTVPLCKLVKQHAMKCIIDFRDLWIFDIRNIKDFFRPLNILRKLYFYPKEYEAVKYADRVITVTPGWKHILELQYPAFKKKMRVIYNGFDGEYLMKSKEAELQNDEQEFKVVTFGKLAYYSEKYASELLKAYAKFEKQNNNSKIIQLGTKEKNIENMIKSYSVNSFVNEPFQDYATGIRKLQKSNVCILIDIRKHAIGTKIYDYIYANKPIIYIGKKNTYLEKMVTSFENGFSCQSSSEIYKILCKIKRNSICYLDKNLVKEKYSREYQNKMYLNIIKEL